MDSVPVTDGLLAPGSTITLDNCAREPIHTPGGIQAHGALLAVAGPDRRIVQRSENAMERLGQREELIGRPLAALLGAETAAALCEPADHASAAGLRPRTVQIGLGRYDAVAYAADPRVTVIEFEACAAATSAEVIADDLAGLLQALGAARTPQELLESAAAWTHELIGFDRVWVYRFEPDDHGVVIVEERAEALPPFLGLHFPARDIPPQARALFLANRVRFICDAFGTASALVPLENPVTGGWLDLSGGILRAVSPMHRQYLQNMGATASMSIALEVDGRLWGLISGHHYSGPRVVEHRVRLACEILGRLVSNQLGLLLREAAGQRRAEVDSHREAILATLARGDGLADALAEAGPALVALCGADGAAVLIGDRVELIGDTPPVETVRALVAAVPGGEAPWVSDALARDLADRPDLAPHLAPSAGAIVLELTRAGVAHIVWFANEYVRSVTWGDNGLAPARDRLHPTGSYATWSEEVTGASRPWTATERDAVLGLRSGIGTVVLDQAEALARANEDLERSNADLEAFTFIVAHDLREPLRNMQSYLGFFLEDHGAGLDADGRGLLDTVLELGVRMNGLMDSLLSHARADRLEPEFVELSLGDVVAEVELMLGTRIGAGAVVVATPDLSFRADRDAMVHILTNLLTNAMKYVAPGQTPRVEIDASRRPVQRSVKTVGRDSAQAVEIRVRDNGIGVPPEFHETIFELFRRLHSRDAYGGGSGAGLAIGRRLARRQGGELWLQSSAPGEGTCFAFTVPVYE